VSSFSVVVGEEGWMDNSKGKGSPGMIMSQWPTKRRVFDGFDRDLGGGRVGDAHSATNDMALPCATFSYTFCLFLNKNG
jgi:hypothetical protein